MFTLWLFECKKSQQRQPQNGSRPNDSKRTCMACTSSKSFAVSFSEAVAVWRCTDSKPKAVPRDDYIEIPVTGKHWLKSKPIKPAKPNIFLKPTKTSPKRPLPVASVSSRSLAIAVSAPWASIPVERPRSRPASAADAAPGGPLPKNPGDWDMRNKNMLLYPKKYWKIYIYIYIIVYTHKTCIDDIILNYEISSPIIPLILWVYGWTFWRSVSTSNDDALIFLVGGLDSLQKGPAVWAVTSNMG